MTLHQLAIFDAVARHRGFTRAAQELRLTQPAVSAEVGQLEREFSLALFERTRRQTGLTDAGRQLHAYAQRLFAPWTSSRRRCAICGSSRGAGSRSPP